mmetsp:Transcript_34275/g.64616  ORF Transcript_34275/g.64616 Transcript_34275/m.64616 type:complete len:88 (+) Transcript_34275:1771-2034(+)
MFYAACVLAAFCMVVTYVVGLYGAAGTAVYCAASAAVSQARLQGARRQQQQPSFLRHQAAGYGPGMGGAAYGPGMGGTQFRRRPGHY